MDLRKRPRTEEEKAILRKVMLENNPFRGKKHSEATRKRFKIAWIERRKRGVSLETRKKLSAAKIGNQNSKGEKCHFWKGGISPTNMLIRASSSYKNWRLKVFKRDNFTCVLCGASKVYLNADHIKPFCKYPELRFELSNGRTLCVPCHRKTDTYGILALKK